MPCPLLLQPPICTQRGNGCHADAVKKAWRTTDKRRPAAQAAFLVVGGEEILGEEVLGEDLLGDKVAIGR
jgi:hypothetical protein